MPDAPLRVLSVEDDPADARLLQEELSRAGLDFEFVRVDDEADFVAALADAPDVVLCEYDLPKFDSRRAMELLRARGSDAPFIVVSGSIGEETAAQTIKQGADDYLLKDRLARLGPAILQSLQQRALKAADARARAAIDEQTQAVAVRAGIASAVALAGEPAYVLNRCCEILVRLAGATYARIWTLNEAEGVLELQCSAGFSNRIDDAYARVPIGRFKVGRIAAEREAFHTNDLAGNPDVPGRARAAETRTTSFAGCPLSVEGRLSGVLAMFSSAPISKAMFEAICASADLVAQYLERKRAEAALRASEEQYRVLAESIPQLVWISRPDGAIEYVNRRAKEYTGATPELLEAKENAWERMIHPEDFAPAAARWAAASDGQPREAEIRLRRADGAYRWHIARQVAVHGVDGAVARWVGTCTDIHDQKQTEAELRQAGDLLRAVTDALPDAVFLKDRDGCYLIFNSAASRFVGKPVEQVLGKTDFELFDRKGALIVVARDRRVLETGVATTAEETLTAAGTTRVYLATKAPYRDSEGRIAGVIGVSRDITEQKRAEEVLRLRDRAISAVAAGVVIADPQQPDCPLIYVSPGFTRLFGYAADEALGRNCRFLQGKDTDPAAVARLRSAMQKGEACSVEILNYRKDGAPVWVDVAVSPIRDEKGRITHFVGIQSDLTVRRRLEERVRQAQKMEAVGLLAGGVAHEFNNLLTVILGYSDLLLGRLAADDPGRGAIAAIREAGDRAVGLTSQLLAFGRRTIVEPKTLDLNEVVEPILKMLQRLLGDDVVVEARLAPDLRRMTADLGRIEQVVLNLAVNARDAMPDGGRLTIRTSNAKVLPEDERAAELRPGPYVRLEVADSGCGMSAEVRARIFEPFFTTKDQGKGTGLGLPTVYGVVKAFGGAVFVTSEVGEGSTFELLFPAAEATAEASAPVPATAARGAETVLVVEDEPGVLRFAKLALESLGYTVMEATDGVAALRLWEADPSKVDLVLTDVMMPKMGGRELSNRLRALKPGVKILFMTGYTDDAVLRNDLNASSEGFLQKPFTPLALARKVRALLDGRG